MYRQLLGRWALLGIGTPKGGIVANHASCRGTCKSGHGCNNPPVARTRRYRSRQGVVYGSVRPHEAAHDPTSLIGRIVGVLIVGGAVGALAIGALAFVGDGTDAPGPGNTSPLATAAAFSPPPTFAPTLPPAPTPSPTPSPDVTALPSPEPTAPPSAPATPFVLEVREGPGFVTFGTQNNSSLRITDPRTSFGTDQRIVWSAQMIEPANSADMRIVISTFDPATSAERSVRTSEVRPNVQGASTFLASVRSSRLDGPGVYVLRYLRGEQVMSEGFFELTN